MAILYLCRPPRQRVSASTGINLGGSAGNLLGIQKSGPFTCFPSSLTTTLLSLSIWALTSLEFHQQHYYMACLYDMRVRKESNLVIFQYPAIYF